MINEKLLQSLYASNFVAYYNAHAGHLHVEGSTFSQDHSLLNDIYDYLWEASDTIAEMIRQLDKPVPAKLSDVVKASQISETPFSKDPKAIFSGVAQDLADLLKLSEAAEDDAEKNHCGGFETVLGDYEAALGKLLWKVKATVGKSYK